MPACIRYLTIYCCSYILFDIEFVKRHRKLAEIDKKLREQKSLTTSTTTTVKTLKGGKNSRIIEINDFMLNDEEKRTCAVMNSNNTITSDNSPIKSYSYLTSLPRKDTHTFTIFNKKCNNHQRVAFPQPNKCQLQQQQSPHDNGENNYYSINLNQIETKTNSNIFSNPIDSGEFGRIIFVNFMKNYYYFFRSRKRR
jgi:hypothetical protein